MVQRFQETCHFVFKSISALSRVILKKEIPYTSMEILQTQNYCPTFFFCKSGSVFTEQWRVGVNNLAWQEEKGRVNLLTNVPPEEVQLLVSLPTRPLETVCERTLWTSWSSVQQNLVFTAVWKKLTFNIVFQTGCSIFLDLTRTKGGEALFLSVGNTHFLELGSSLITSLCSNSWENNIWTSCWSSNRSIPSTLNPGEGILLCDLQRNRAFCGWNPRPHKGAQIQ